MSEKHLTTKQVAERMSLNVETIRRLCRKLEMAPIVVVGNRIRIPENTYKRFIESHTVNGSEKSHDDSFLSE